MTSLAAPRWPSLPETSAAVRAARILAPRHVHVVPSLNMGGAERIVLDVSSALSRMGFPVDVAVMRDVGVAHGTPRDGAGPRRLGALPWPDRIAEVARLARESGLPAYCHLTSPDETRKLWDLGVETVPVVHNARAGWRQSPSDWEGGPVPFVVACGDAVAADVRAAGYGGVVHVVRHVVPTRARMSPDERAAVRSALGAGPDTLLVGTVGRLVGQKRHDLAVRVLAGLARSGHDARLLVVGPVLGDEGRTVAAGIASEARRLGVPGRVMVVGAVADAGSLMQALDVHLTCSDYEGVSVATMEAAALGVPCVSTDVGGQREAVADGDVLVPRGASVADWVEAVELALSSPRRPVEAATRERCRDASAMLWPWLLATRALVASERTLFVTGNMDVGGAQRSLSNLLTELGRRGRDVACAVAGPVGVPAFVRAPVAAGVPFFDVSGSGPGRSMGLAGRAGRILSVVAEGGYGQVAFWNMDAQSKLLVAKALRGGRVPTYDVSPGPSLLAELDAASDVARLLSTDPDAYLGSLAGFVSKYGSGGLPPDRGSPAAAYVVRNGVPSGGQLLLPQDGPRPPDGYDPDRAVLVVGRIVSTKMPHLMPLVARGLADRLPGSSLTLVGGAHGDREDACFARTLAASGGVLPDNMFVVPPDDRTRGFMPRFAALLLLSRDQGCPNVSLEAMACGLVVVANDDGGTREQVRDGLTGILLRSRDEAALVEEAVSALAALLVDATRKASLRDGARFVARNEFSVAAMADAYDGIFGLDEGTR